MIVTIGDSVAWGQGLREHQKFDRLLASARGTELVRLAHSGAILGDAEDAITSVSPAEIPVSYPSLWQQVRSVENWDEVDLVLVNGGMNDVDLRRIVNPFVSPSTLTRLTRRACHTAMTGLLAALAARLTRPEAQILVLGYYPILSHASGYPSHHHPHALQRMHGVVGPSLIPDILISRELLIKRAIGHCLQFWKESELALRHAVDDANAVLSRRPCRFVPLPFAEGQSLWAPESLLFELTPELGPEDEVIVERTCHCDGLYPVPAHALKHFQCHRASVGHPSVEGAARIAERLSRA